jgi:hypothetical protein
MGCMGKCEPSEPFPGGERKSLSRMREQVVEVRWMAMTKDMLRRVNVVSARRRMRRMVLDVHKRRSRATGVSNGFEGTSTRAAY